MNDPRKLPLRRIAVDAGRAAHRNHQLQLLDLQKAGHLVGLLPGYQVHIDGHPQRTQAYAQGDRTLRVVRCRACGCTTHWGPLDLKVDSRRDVNIRNFDPQWIGSARMRMLDGADTWKSTSKEPSGSRPV